MTRSSNSAVVVAISLISLSALLLLAEPKTPPQVLTGKAAFADFSQQKPGIFRNITLADLPQPFATESAFNMPSVVLRLADALPQPLPGFKVELYASVFDEQRLMRTAPNGDHFLAQNKIGTIN